MIGAALETLGQATLFIYQILKMIFHRKVDRVLIYQQTWNIIEQSWLITLSAGFFVGAIMSVQFTLQMKEFGALGYLGGLATSGTFREVGPLLIAFMLSGRIGAYTSAELGTMKITEQIDALRCLGADPMIEIVAPRFVGIILSSFFLLGIGLVASVAGGSLLAWGFAGVSPEEYLRHIPTLVTGFSIINGLFKCLIFAFVLSSVCTFIGYNTGGGAAGVGRSVVNTAVATMVMIVFADWLTTYLANQWIVLQGVG
jgi:phospholipid/cholesterol/gamma-HCH transport system permease protein